MENSDGTIQVFSENTALGIDKLVATSSDSLIVQIVSVQKDSSGAFSNVKIHATGAGSAVIALAAPGFFSSQFPITVYKAHEDASQLLIKTTPNSFSTKGPSHGYVSVEMVNAAGEPVKAISDTPIAITTSDNTIVKLFSDHLVIKQGSYFAVGQFNIDQPGSATITASSSVMQPTSSTVTVKSLDADTIQDYVYPQTVSSLNSANTYLIVQLHDSSGNPVIAKEDIPIAVQVSNSTVGTTPANPLSIHTTPYSWSSQIPNAQGQTPLIQTNQELKISKGSYWGYVPLEVSSGVKGNFVVSVSAKGYLSSLPFQFNATASNSILDNKIARADILPILETGKNELIGVLHLQDTVPTPEVQSSSSTTSTSTSTTTSTSSGTTTDSNYNPVIANNNLQFEMDSSNLRAVSVPKISMDWGSQAALIFAQTGSSADPVSLNLVTTVPQTITPTVTAESVNTINFVAEPIIPQVLPATTFPLAVYMTNDGALDSFATDFNVAISPQDSVKTSSLSISKNMPVFVSDVTLLKDGSQSINVVSPDYSTQFTVDSATTKPKGVLLDFPNQMVSNSNYTFSLELLDGQQGPTVTDSDINLQMVSSDPTVIQVPDHILMKKGSYYATFEAHTIGGGAAEITVLANELPLTKFDFQITAITPTLTITAPDRTDPGMSISATLLDAYNQTVISGIPVSWKVSGATIQKMDSITDKDGKATILLVATDPSTVSITATTSSNQYGTQTVTKQITINPPLQPATAPDSNAQNPSSGFSFPTIGPIVFVIPAALAAAFAVLYRKGMLERILGPSIVDKISSIKERMMELRQN